MEVVMFCEENIKLFGFKYDFQKKKKNYKIGFAQKKFQFIFKNK